MRLTSKGRFYLLYGVGLLCLIAAGRITALFYSYTAVDIAYASWVSELLYYMTEVLNGAKCALGYTAIAYAVWQLSVKDGVWASLLFFGGLAAENAARVLIDLFSSALTYYGVPLAVASVSIQLLFETLFLVFALLAALFFGKRHGKGKGPVHSSLGAARTAVLALLLVMLARETGYLLEHLRLYGELNAGELALAIGGFLEIAVMYGGVPLLLCEAAHAAFRKAMEE